MILLHSAPGLQAVVGGAEEIRTPDLRRAKAALSQLSYGPLVWPPEASSGPFFASAEAASPDRRTCLLDEGWWAMVDSNHRPRSYQDRALTS